MAGGEPPCDAVQAELALELVEGELAVELPAHVRAFARAHADGRSPPPAPLVARLASTLAAARAALPHDLVRDRALALLRLVAPIAIEDDPAVATARGKPPSWPGLAELAAARDAAARAPLGDGSSVAWLHRLHGSDGEPAAAEPGDPLGPPIDGWHARGPASDRDGVLDAWQAIAARLGIGDGGRVRVDFGGPGIQPRAFVVEPGREVIVVVPAQIDTPAARFAVLHELGHAAAALAAPIVVPRVLDEAVAAYVARLAEPPSWLPPKWASELAPAARRRRVALAARLDAIERGLPALRETPGAAPPWALWHDPGAQAAYVAAEAMADGLARDLGSSPPRGRFLHALDVARAQIDRRARL